MHNLTSFNSFALLSASIEPDNEDEYGYTLLETIKTFKDSEVQCTKEGDRKIADSSQVYTKTKIY